MQWHMAAPITSVSAITAETHLNGCGQSTPLQYTATLLCSGIYLEQPAVPVVKFGEHTSNGSGNSSIQKVWARVCKNTNGRDAAVCSGPGGDSRTGCA